MAYKQSPGRMNMPKTGRGVDAPALMTGKSPAYQIDPKSGTKMEYDGGVLRRPKADGSSETVLGGAYDAGGVYIPKTKSQKASDFDKDPRNPKGSESKRRYKERVKAEKNKPENIEATKKRKAVLKAKKEAQNKKNNKK